VRHKIRLVHHPRQKKSEKNWEQVRNHLLKYSCLENRCYFSQLCNVKKLMVIVVLLFTIKFNSFYHGDIVIINKAVKCVY
jgi:hypothetical protein